MLGLTLEEAEAAQLFEIWPDCELSVSVFAAMSTQWQVGPMGPTGLNYASLPVVLQRMKVTDSDTVFGKRPISTTIDHRRSLRG
jgi:hypothetical protein